MIVMVLRMMVIILRILILRMVVMILRMLVMILRMMIVRISITMVTLHHLVAGPADPGLPALLPGQGESLVTALATEDCSTEPVIVDDDYE